jgi:hypothetical protein
MVRRSGSISVAADVIITTTGTIATIATDLDR